MASELARSLKSKDEKLTNLSIDRISKTYLIRAIAQDPIAIQKILSYVRENYRGVLVEKRETVEKVYQSSETDETKLQSIYQQLVENLSKKEGIIDIERSQGSSLFRIIFKEGANFQEVQSILSSKFTD